MGRAIRPRRVLATIAVAILAVAASAGVMFARSLDDPPGRDEVAADLVMGGELLAYEVWDGEPWVVFRSPDGRAVRLDHLILDLISIEFPPTPAWQLSGGWHTLRPGRSDPAAVGVVRGESTTLFGPIASQEITRLEVEYNGQWRGFDVGAPGFLVRLQGFDRIPDGYRWLDRDGAVVWSEGRLPPIRD